MENNIYVMPKDYEEKEAKRLTITEMLSDLAFFIRDNNINVDVFRIKNVYPKMYMFESKSNVLIIHDSPVIWESDICDFVAYLKYDGKSDNGFLTYNALKQELLDMK